ncbi:hypothetical protein [Pontixanthobacter sp.]|uniref:hypothetical protein n=1 Tax=Pontixanthobacter sp. TaxID=2792078 RepID=UPI003C7A3A5F
MMKDSMHAAIAATGDMSPMALTVLMTELMARWAMLKLRTNAKKWFRSARNFLMISIASRHAPWPPSPLWHSRQPLRRARTAKNLFHSRKPHDLDAAPGWIGVS